MKEQKDVRQRIEEGEFAQSAEISASYLDEDILIIDNVKVLQNPDPMRFQMNMIASCQRGSLRAELNGREFTVEKGDIFISPPNSILDIKEVSEDFACTAMCVSNHGLLGILRSHISVWNRAMYVSKVSVLKMNEVDMVFYSKFTDLVRLCLDPKFNDRSSWKPYRREIVETLLKSALLAVSNLLLRRLKLAQETSIVLREETKVAHAIFQVGDTLNTHTEGITRIDIAVDTASLKIMRVNHTAT
jgi:hypothetical protein